MPQVVLICDSNSVWTTNSDTVKCDYGFETINIDLLLNSAAGSNNPFYQMELADVQSLLVASIAVLGLAAIIRLSIKLVWSKYHEKD